jgi:hypothetical protein
MKVEGSSLEATRPVQGHASPPLLLLEDRLPVALSARLGQVLVRVLNQLRQRVWVHLSISFNLCHDGELSCY